MKHSVVIASLLCCSLLISIFMTPTIKIADERPNIDLEIMIPAEFGDWTLDSTPTTLLINPKLQATLDLIYNQTLTRTYIHKTGKRLMLSIAYGGDQSDSMQVHRPEICYPAQGMPIISQKNDSISLSHGGLPVRRLISQRGSRYEPITYWVRMGDKAVITNYEQKLAKMTYTLSGRIPDGLLFRTSTVGLKEKESFRLQDDFINELIESLDKHSINFIFGSFS